MTSLEQSTKYTCWYPLLPTFSARIIFALRTLLGIACCAIFTLSPQTSNLIQGELLLGVGFIVTIKITLGSTIQTACRLFLAGSIATIYCLCIINICPQDIYFAVGATNVLVFIIFYTDLPTIVRRFSILPTCIILLQWFVKSDINTIYILHLWLSLSTGALLAIFISCIPLPVFPTAYRELIIRMKFITRQIRREITAILLLISQYHNIRLNDNLNDEIDRKESHSDDDFLHHSTSFENLKDDYLLKSDIQDLDLLVNEELKEIERALEEISYEPYFIFLNIFHFIPFLKKSLTLQSRLKIWTTSLASLQRTITGMLALDHHHHGFAGQRQLINSISLLLDSILNFMDSTLPYRISDPTYTLSCRAKVEELLEDFFKTYSQVCENSHQINMSNTDAIHLNTFLLLILRLVHVIITAAETSETSNINPEQIINSSIRKKFFDWKKLINYFGLKPSLGKFIRAIKTSLSVLISAIVVLTFRERLQAYGWVYWAPMTTALVSDSSEGSTLRLSFQRLMAVLLGSTYAYIIFLIAQNHLAIGIFISLFVAFMGYIQTNREKEYFASVCAQSASIITFISNQEGLQGSNKAVLARTSLTFVGIFIHVLISNLILPISARGLIKKKVSIMINNISMGLKSTTDDFCSFIGSTTNVISTDKKATLTNNLMTILAETEHIANDFPTLLEEALSEPNYWKRPFIEVKDRYDDISKILKRIIFNIRFIHRCTTILKAETKLHFESEAKLQLRRTSLISIDNNTGMKRSHTWTITELRQQKQLQDDLDVPLTIFMRYSSHSVIQLDKKSLVSNNSLTSIRLTNISSYQSVLQHISTLEKSIQQVLFLTKKLIEKQTINDIESFKLQEFHHENSLNEQEPKTIQNHSSFENIKITKNHCKLFSCCHNDQENHNQLLRNAVDIMLASLIQFLYANNHFIRTKLISTHSIGDILSFHTLSYAFKDMVQATTDLAKNARRIKHIDTRTLISTEYDDKIL